MKKFLIYIIKLILSLIFCFYFLFVLNEYGISQILNSSKEFNILFNPKHQQSIIDFKLNQEKKEISIIGTSRTAGFEKGMFSNKSFYNYSMIVNSIRDVKNLVNDLNINKGDTIILGIDQWNFNNSYFYRLLNNYKTNKLSFPFTLIDKKKKTSSHLLIGEKSIDNFSGFRNDGSYFDGKRFIIPKEELKDYNFIDTYSLIQNGNSRFEYGSKVDLNQIEILEELLVYSKENEIILIGFFPPFAPSVNKMMNNPKYDYSYIKESSKLIAHLFDEYGFKFKDFTNMNFYDDSFYLDGFHCNRNIYYNILKELKIPVNKNFDNTFNISIEEANFLNEYFFK